MAAQLSWSTRLKEHCAVRGYGDPVFQYVSDRRGGRTAWSCIVTVQNVTYPAQFWRAGEQLDQAREDAAEMALRSITGYTGARSREEVPPASHYKVV